MPKIWSCPQRVAALVIAAGFFAGIAASRADDVGPGNGVKFPFVIYAEQGGAENHFIPAGWIGNTKNLKLDEGWTQRPHAGKTCVHVEYAAPGQWAGIVWQDPANDWGEVPGGWNLTGAKKLTFWARGEKGEETVHFKFGVLGPDKKYPDSASGETSDLKLTTDWKEYEIDLAGKDLTHVKTGFVLTLGGQGGPVGFDLDDMQFE